MSRAEKKINELQEEASTLMLRRNQVVEELDLIKNRLMQINGALDALIQIVKEEQEED